MTITLILFATAVVLELFVHGLSKWRWPRRVLAVMALCVHGFAVGALLLYEPNVFTAYIAFISLYRMFNMIRVVQERMHERYLRNATRTTSLSLFGLQALGLAGFAAWQTVQVGNAVLWGGLAAVQTFVALFLLMSVQRNLKKTVWPPEKTHYIDRDLPTVTVAIPARNETEDLRLCLEDVIRSDYPKLEVIVLDDCSQLKRTPEIIRDYAQDGVRFVQGHEPAETWLAKNQAYHKLAQEASGQYILFCGVDVRFDRHSIRSLISTMVSRDKQMLCVMPKRAVSAYGHLSLVQAMRYWWELVPPRRLFRRPPVLSSCWVITKDALKKAGGFAAVSRSIMPEAHFAKELIKTDGYSFLRVTDGLGITSNKQVAEQRDTAVRTRYPQLHRRPEQVAILTVLELVFLVLPFVMGILGFWVDIGLAAHVLAGVASLVLILTYEMAVLSTKVNTWWFGLFGQPLAALTDIGLVHYSMSRYEFSTVAWKGRNICIPVMHVVPHLPDLPPETHHDNRRHK